jgi:hypothetical protein
MSIHFVLSFCCGFICDIFFRMRRCDEIDHLPVNIEDFKVVIDAFDW